MPQWLWTNQFFRSRSAGRVSPIIGALRLLRSTGRRNEACAMLADIYTWFTKSFDTADLKDAEALLDELEASP